MAHRGGNCDYYGRRARGNVRMYGVEEDRTCVPRSMTVFQIREDGHWFMDSVT